jgi:putative transcriptional regulator
VKNNAKILTSKLNSVYAWRSTKKKIIFVIMNGSYEKLDKGKILISAPYLNDIFKRSVILLTENDDNGTVGFIINKPLRLKIHEVVEDFPNFDATVHLGGPVQPDMLNFIHKAGDVIDGGYEISNGIYWGGNFETFKILAEAGSLNPLDFRFFLGYAGWNPNQLNNEFKINSWYVNSLPIDDIFSDDSEHLWQKILINMGGEYKVIATFPEDPSVN